MNCGLRDDAVGTIGVSLCPKHIPQPEQDFVDKLLARQPPPAPVNLQRATAVRQPNSHFYTHIEQEPCQWIGRKLRHLHMQKTNTQLIQLPGIRRLAPNNGLRLFEIAEEVLQSTEEGRSPARARVA